MEKVELDKELVKKILEYLATKPYSEVYQAVAVLSEALQKSSKATEGVKKQ